MLTNKEPLHMEELTPCFLQYECMHMADRAHMQKACIKYELLRNNLLCTPPGLGLPPLTRCDATAMYTMLKFNW
jgi:hypothetical protein